MKRSCGRSSGKKFFNELLVPNDVSFVNISGTNATSLSFLKKMLHVISVDATSTDIADLKQVPRIETITSIELSGSPLARLQDYRIMLLIALSSRLAKIDGVSVTTNEKKIAKSLEEYISSFLYDGWVVMALNPLTLRRGKQTHVMSLDRERKKRAEQAAASDTRSQTSVSENEARDSEPKPVRRMAPVRDFRGKRLVMPKRSDFPPREAPHPKPSETQPKPAAVETQTKKKPTNETRLSEEPKKGVVKRAASATRREKDGEPFTRQARPSDRLSETTDARRGQKRTSSVTRVDRKPIIDGLSPIGKDKDTRTDTKRMATGSRISESEIITGSGEDRRTRNRMALQGNGRDFNSLIEESNSKRSLNRTLPGTKSRRKESDADLFDGLFDEKKSLNRTFASLRSRRNESEGDLLGGGSKKTPTRGVSSAKPKRVESELSRHLKDEKKSMNRSLTNLQHKKRDDLFGSPKRETDSLSRTLSNGRVLENSRSEKGIASPKNKEEITKRDRDSPTEKAKNTSKRIDSDDLRRKKQDRDSPGDKERNRNKSHMASHDSDDSDSDMQWNWHGKNSRSEKRRGGVSSSDESVSEEMRKTKSGSPQGKGKESPSEKKSPKRNDRSVEVKNTKDERRSDHKRKTEKRPEGKAVDSFESSDDGWKSRKKKDSSESSDHVKSSKTKRHKQEKSVSRLSDEMEDEKPRSTKSRKKDNISSESSDLEETKSRSKKRHTKENVSSESSDDFARKKSLNRRKKRHKKDSISSESSDFEEKKSRRKKHPKKGNVSSESSDFEEKKSRRKKHHKKENISSELLDDIDERKSRRKTHKKEKFSSESSENTEDRKSRTKKQKKDKITSESSDVIEDRKRSKKTSQRKEKFISESSDSVENPPSTTKDRRKNDVLNSSPSRKSAHKHKRKDHDTTSDSIDSETKKRSSHSSTKKSKSLLVTVSSDSSQADEIPTTNTRKKAEKTSPLSKKSSPMESTITEIDWKADFGDKITLKPSASTGESPKRSPITFLKKERLEKKLQISSPSATADDQAQALEVTKKIDFSKTQPSPKSIPKLDLSPEQKEESDKGSSRPDDDQDESTMTSASQKSSTSRSGTTSTVRKTRIPVSIKKSPSSESMPQKVEKSDDYENDRKQILKQKLATMRQQMKVKRDSQERNKPKKEVAKRKNESDTESKVRDGKRRTSDVTVPRPPLLNISEADPLSSNTIITSLRRQPDMAKSLISGELESISHPLLSDSPHLGASDHEESSSENEILKLLHLPSESARLDEFLELEKSVEPRDKRASSAARNQSHCVIEALDTRAPDESGSSEDAFMEDLYQSQLSMTFSIALDDSSSASDEHTWKPPISIRGKSEVKKPAIQGGGSLIERFRPITGPGTLAKKVTGPAMTSKQSIVPLDVMEMDVLNDGLDLSNIDSDMADDSTAKPKSKKVRINKAKFAETQKRSFAKTEQQRGKKTKTVPGMQTSQTRARSPHTRVKEVPGMKASNSPRTVAPSSFDSIGFVISDSPRTRPSNRPMESSSESPKTSPMTGSSRMILTESSLLSAESSGLVSGDYPRQRISKLPRRSPTPIKDKSPKPRSKPIISLNDTGRPSSTKR